MNEQINQYMEEALKLAAQAEEIDEVPVGCVIVFKDQIIARSFNKRQTSQISTSHAEILAIEEACQVLGSWRLEDCDLYVTLEPCPMCAGAIIQSRIRNVYFGASDYKGGCFGSLIDLSQVKGFNHYPAIHSGIMSEQCSSLLSNYFRKKRKQKAEQKQKTVKNPD